MTNKEIIYSKEELQLTDWWMNEKGVYISFQRNTGEFKRVDVCFSPANLSDFLMEDERYPNDKEVFIYNMGTQIGEMDVYELYNGQHIEQFWVEQFLKEELSYAILTWQKFSCLTSDQKLIYYELIINESMQHHLPYMQDLFRIIERKDEPWYMNRSIMQFAQTQFNQGLQRNSEPVRIKKIA